MNACINEGGIFSTTAMRVACAPANRRDVRAREFPLPGQRVPRSGWVWASPGSVSAVLARSCLVSPRAVVGPEGQWGCLGLGPRPGQEAPPEPVARAASLPAGAESKDAAQPGQAECAFRLFGGCGSRRGDLLEAFGHVRVGVLVGCHQSHSRREPRSQFPLVASLYRCERLRSPP